MERLIVCGGTCERRWSRGSGGETEAHVEQALRLSGGLRQPIRFSVARQINLTGREIPRVASRYLRLLQESLIASTADDLTWNNAPSNRLPTRLSHVKACGTSMSYFRKRSIVFWSFPFIIFLSGCSAKPECDSFETRDAVLKTVSDDHNNALGKYAAKNSTMASSSDASSEAEKSQRPLYLLGEKIVTTSTSADRRTLTCSGSMSVMVGDTKASKEINFTVQQLSDGKISVSVTPFQF